MSETTQNNTEALEKQKVQKYFGYQRNGFFVEVGANEADSIGSQTYHLEKELEWRGVLIEPIEYLYRRLCEKRPNSSCHQVVCTSPEKVGMLELNIPTSDNEDLHVHASLELDLDHSSHWTHRTQKVAGVTLNCILNKEQVEQIDFLSIDVEGTELDVLKGFDFKKFKPRLILIEDRMVFLDKHYYLKRKGYCLRNRTGMNNWYVPKETQVQLMSVFKKMRLFKKMYLSIWFRKFKESIKMKNLGPLRKL